MNEFFGKVKVVLRAKVLQSLLLQTENDHRVVQNVAAASRKRLRDICWSRSDHTLRSLIVKIATTLGWLSAAVSE